MADLLSNQYATVFSTSIDPKQLPGKPRKLTSSGQSLHSISFTEEDIIQAINEISLTAAAGPDGFPAMNAFFFYYGNADMLPCFAVSCPEFYWMPCNNINFTGREQKD